MSDDAERDPHLHRDEDERQGANPYQQHGHAGQLSGLTAGEVGASLDSLWIQGKMFNQYRFACYATVVQSVHYGIYCTTYQPRKKGSFLVLMYFSIMIKGVFA